MVPSPGFPHSLPLFPSYSSHFLSLGFPPSHFLSTIPICQFSLPLLPPPFLVHPKCSNDSWKLFQVLPQIAPLQSFLNLKVFPFSLCFFPLFCRQFFPPPIFPEQSPLGNSAAAALECRCKDGSKKGGQEDIADWRGGSSPLHTHRPPINLETPY